MKTQFLFALLCLLTAGSFTRADEAILEQGDRLAVVGDSITEQKLYSKFIETYLLACYPDLNIQTFQFGWGGERAPGFAARMENDLIPWKPDVVTTCYGMNDGSYRAYEEGIGKAYEEGMRRIIERMKQAGATVVVGSPGVVDSDTWSRNNPDFDQVYNDNLQRLGQIAKKLADENHFPHADVFGAMMQTMVAAKEALGNDYHVAGGDGVHPASNGHLIMAYAFLKALGLDGNIGTITVDVGANTATATAGHKVLSTKDGAVEIESTRYPFCFYGGEKDPNGTASILPYAPFNAELNRLMLKVNGLKGDQAEVTFGTQSKTFTKEQLTEGVNLAAEFLDNPFVPSFTRVLEKVGEKQAVETTIIKSFITNYRHLDRMLADDPEVKAALESVRKEMIDVDNVAYQAAKAEVKPVRYTIQIK